VPRAAKIIWVIGDGTHVGKTTIATAFIRALSRRGIPTVGFKPYASSMLKDVIDFMLEKIPNAKCALFGSDAWELSMASPLTPGELADTVAPAQLLCHPKWGSTILARTGSAATGDVEYFRSGYTASIAERPDIVELARRTGLPFADAPIVEPLNLLATPPSTPQKQQRAFDHLVALGARAVVCEGGSRYLPVWPGSPHPDHVVVLLEGMVHLFPSLGVRYDAGAGATVNSIDEFFQLLVRARAKCRSSPLYLVERERRREMADRIVDTLIDDAGDGFP